MSYRGICYLRIRKKSPSPDKSRWPIFPSRESIGLFRTDVKSCKRDSNYTGDKKDR